MTKVHKSRHRIPACALELGPEPISDRYQTEIDMSTQRLERRYCKALKAFEAAQRRAERVRHLLEAKQVTKRAATQRRYDELLLIVEERRRELREVALLMMPADYNGRDSKRRLVRHESGAITIPLGATSQKLKQRPVPVFPVRTGKLS